MNHILKDRLIFAFVSICAVFLYHAGQNNVPFLWILSNGFGYISVMFHEVGHAIFNWLYGYAALPGFDFVHGGGMTIHQDRVWFLQYAVWAGLIFIAYQLWRAEHFFILIAHSLFTIFIFISSLTFFHEDVWLFMGLGSEALVGSFLLGRAYHGVLLTRPSERWLNAIIGGHMVYGVLYLAWNLMADAYFAANYEMQKGAHRFGDIHRIQDNHYFTSVDPVCWALIIFTLICIVLNMTVLWLHKQTAL